MFELKGLSKEAIPAALAKVERYRLLNEPEQAESICHDILALEPENQQALIALILAVTEQFVDGPSERVTAAQALLGRLQREYDRAYFAGIICERRGRSLLAMRSPGAGFVAYDWLREAMVWFEKAEAMKRPGNDEAVLRWNSCARFLNEHPELAPSPEERNQLLMLE
jgi:hypothetical protein